MKFNQILSRDQAKVSHECIHLLGQYGGSASAPLAPPRGAGDRDDSLLYLSCFNSDNLVDLKKEKRTKKPLKKGQLGWKGDNWTPNNKDYKIVKSLRQNIKHWAKIYGVEKLFFLTLTFKEENLDAKEAQRRFNNFNRQFNRINQVQWLYKGVEPQERGTLHYHIIGYHTHDLGAEKLDWEAYKATGKYRKEKKWGLMYKNQRALTASANDHLKEMWGKVRKIAEGSKMGRSEFLPVRSANSIGSYVGKYLGKCFASQNNNEWSKGLRRFSYSKKAPQVHGRQFSWVKGTKELTWRQKLAGWAHGMGVKDPDDLERKYGKMWALEQRESINYYGPRFYNGMKQNKFGHSRPAMYPTGVTGNILKHMGESELPEDFHYQEYQLWEDFLSNKPSRSLRQHAEHFRKHERARKAKALHEKIYG